MTIDEAILHMTLRREELKHSVSSDLDEDIKAFDVAIKALEQTKWIPISERVPEYGEPVLTWDGNCYFVEKRIPCIRDENGEPICSDWWVSDDYDESESEYYPNLRDGACIAWMPLHSQWKGTDLEDDD